MTPRQKQFVREYLVDLNATQAAIRAGYSERTAYSQGDRLLRNAEVASAIQTAMDARSVRVRLSADDVLEELAILGQSDVWNYEVDDRGNVTLAEGVPRRAIRAVSSIKKKVRHLEGGLIEYETEIKLWDKNSALEKAGKHLKLFTEKHEHTGKDGGPLETRLTIVEEIVDAGTDEDDPAAPGPAGVSPE